MLLSWMGSAKKWGNCSCAKNSYVGQYAIATIYGADDVVSQNLTKSFEYFTKSATQNFRDAQYDLGLGVTILVSVMKKGVEFRKMPSKRYIITALQHSKDFVLLKPDLQNATETVSL